MNPDDLRAIVEKPLTLEKRSHEAMLTGRLAPSTAPAYAAFRQAFNPSTCLALLDELDGLKARVESAEKVLRQADAAISRAHAETRSMEDADLFEQVRIAASAHFTKHPEGKI